MTRSLLFLALILTACSSTADLPPVQTEPVVNDEQGAQPVPGNPGTPNANFNRPKLVVGVTVDQMRLDYLYRYWNDFTEDGFKRLVQEGTFCSNNHYSFAPTYTGPGHASIYTGTTPAIHGIIANDWYDREEGMVYCAQDSAQRGTGTDGTGGRMSPHRMLSTTFTDELRLATQFEGKVIGMSMKDRGSILPAGHHPNGAYWFIGNDEGNFVTSSYYTETLPQWVQDFNAQRLPDAYLAEGWTLLRDTSAYNESYVDNNAHEQPYPGMIRAVFPYDFSDITNERYDLIKATPHGASLLVDFAKAAIEAEQLGADTTPDVLALSFSNTDYAGHQFGPQAMEVQDTYLRLDEDIARLLNYLDEQVGEGAYVVFLTADHGGATVPSYGEKFGMPGGYWKPQAMLDVLNGALQAEFGDGEWISNYSNDQLFFDRELMAVKEVDLEDATEIVVRIARTFPEVYTALALEEFLEQDYDELPLQTIQRGIHPQRSGDVIIVTLPGYIEYGFQGTTHGSPFSYDTHVPLIFYGAGVPAGVEIARRTNIRDIAPTVSNILRIPQPSGCTGNPVYEMFERR